MKKLLLIPLLLLFFTFQSCGSLATSNSTPIVKVVPVENASKNELYVRANNWMVSTFNSAESVIQFSDKESGTVTGRYYLSPVANASDYAPRKDAYAIINIQVKDGASKITVTPEKIKYMKGNMFNLYDEEVVQYKIAALMRSFEEAIQKENNNDW